MKIKVLIKESMDKTYNVLPVIKNNQFLKESQDLVEFYNDDNIADVFNRTYDQFMHGKFRRMVVVDDYAYGPFLSVSKMRGQVATTCFDEYSAYLARAHNNTKTCIVPLLRTDPARLNNIINAFCVAEFEGGRHVTRLQIMHGAITAPAKETIKFSEQPTKTVVLGSDHAGFALKEVVKEHLMGKGYKVIDVGTNNLDSTHYSLFGVAMTKHYAEASFAIGICWTGMGMANTLNKFKGIRACVCMNPENVKVARDTYGCNTLVMGSKFSNKEDALKTVDMYIETKPVDKTKLDWIDKEGFNFDLYRFNDIKMEKGVIVPPELK